MSARHAAGSRGQRLTVGDGEVTNMRSPQTMGVECPSPGRSVFHRTFLVSLHSTGGLAYGATPVPKGPRHCGQKRSAPLPPYPSSAATGMCASENIAKIEPSSLGIVVPISSRSQSISNILRVLMKFSSDQARVKEGAAGSDLVERTFAKQPESVSDEGQVVDG